ncbi:hypothetical protein CSUI_003533 [Cystoisospora suis]|uniref:Uncharacterized protein n=1 Tax=Cystoisospora suis TaxID=483139 RepID=A0A2C6L527_9APIC|nr:hypothetical protein CSUI_003533 [Cystoisospora suis]
MAYVHGDREGASILIKNSRFLGKDALEPFLFPVVACLGCLTTVACGAEGDGDFISRAEFAEGCCETRAFPSGQPRHRSLPLNDGHLCLPSHANDFVPRSEKPRNAKHVSERRSPPARTAVPQDENRSSAGPRLWSASQLPGSRQTVPALEIPRVSCRRIDGGEVQLVPCPLAIPVMPSTSWE